MLNCSARISLCTMLLAALCRHSTSQPLGVDVDLHVDQSGWIDPADPLQKPLSLSGAKGCSSEELLVHCRDCKEETERLKVHIRGIEETQANSIDALLKHILRNFLQRLNIDETKEGAVSREARAFFPPEGMHVVRKYLNSEKVIEEVGLREDLRYALEDFLVEVDQGATTTLFSLLHRLLPYLLIANILILPPALMIICRSMLSTRSFAALVLIATFCMSYHFTYMRKYQEVLAQRMERVRMNVPDVCSSKGLLNEAYDALLSYVRIKGKSECLQSYEDLLIEPLLLVDPLQVLGEVITNFFLSPLLVAGGHFNKFFNDFFINSPFPLAVLKGVCLVILLFYLSGYRIKTLFATIEPAVVRYLPLHLSDNQSNVPRARYRRVATAPEIVELEEHMPEQERKMLREKGDSGAESDQSSGPWVTSPNFDDSNVTNRRARRRKGRPASRTDDSSVELS